MAERQIVLCSAFVEKDGKFLFVFFAKVWRYLADGQNLKVFNAALG